jgi:hypothetical protein
VKLAVPATVSVPVSVIAPAEFTFNDPVVVKSTPKSTPPVPALIVTFPSPVEPPVVKLTALPVPVAFNVNGVLEEVNPPTEIVPLSLFPTIIFAAVIKPNSVLDNKKLPAPEPNPMALPVFAARNVVSAAPDEIELLAPKATSLAVIDNELLVVLNN